MMANDNWPMSLKRNAAVIDLAQALQHARADYYELPHCELRDLPASARERYISAAYALIERVMPEPAPDTLFQFAAASARAHFTTGLHRADKVVGVIEPREHHGVDGNR